MRAPIGIIGGSGLYQMEGLVLDRSVAVATPFGEPSGPVALGHLDGAPVAFLARHGEGLVAHVSFAEPTCLHLSETLLAEGRELDLPIEGGATYVCMEGPAFSTRAESRLHQSWGADLIGMTQVTEARLAREAELCYACIALVTDYDAWREEAEGVDAASVLQVMHANVDKAQRLLRAVVPLLSHAARPCACGQSLKAALFTAPAVVPREARERLALLVAKYGYGVG